MKKKTNNYITGLLVLILLTGLSLLLYPSVSEYWNSFHQTRAIATYAEDVANMNEEQYEKFWKAAEKYNRKLQKQQGIRTLSEEDKKEYDKQLNISGIGVMGYVEIPKIASTLPIYHGTEESVLQIAVGHLEWSSLPVGGESTHCVLSGHRGLPSAKLFTNLDMLTEGDVFMLRVLDEVLTYEVDQILIVEPEHTEALDIVKGMDYCTLVTCTPYGINTHRLLVRGHRIENLDAYDARITADGVQLEPLMVAVFVAIPLLLLLIIILLLLPRKTDRGHGGDSDDEI